MTVAVDDKRDYSGYQNPGLAKYQGKTIRINGRVYDIRIDEIGRYVELRRFGEPTIRSSHASVDNCACTMCSNHSRQDWFRNAMRVAVDIQREYEGWLEVDFEV